MKKMPPFNLAMALVGLLALGSIPAMAADPVPGSAAPGVWQVSTWVAPDDKAAEDMVNTVIANVSQMNASQKQLTILVTGKGAVADSLAGKLQTLLGKDSISRIETIAPEKLVGAGQDAKATLIIRVTDTPQEAISPGEKFLLQADKAKTIEGYIQDSAKAIRIVQGQLKDPRTVADPMLKAGMENFQKVFGDWSTPEKRDVLARWEKASGLADKILTGLHDAQLVGDGKWRWEGSAVLAKVWHWGLNSGFGKLLEAIPKDALPKELLKGGIKDLPGVLGYGELADGIWEQVSKGHMTIDAIDHYCDAAVSASWGAVALVMSGGNTRVAQTVGSVAVMDAQLLRKDSQQAFKDVYDRFFGTEVNDAFDQWQVEQLSNARRGRTLVSWEDFAAKAGFSAAAISPKKSVADDLLYACKRMEEAQTGTLDTARSRPIAPAPDVALSGQPLPDTNNPTVKGKPNDPTVKPGDPPKPTPMPVVSPDLEKAVLAEDWKGILKILDAKKVEELTAVERFVKGHACLATNRNEESLLLLKNSGKDADVAQWAAWANLLATGHPKSTIAIYFKGDSLARQMKHDEAVAVFSEGLQLDKKYPLLLNARAVCYAHLQKWDAALIDLDDAAKVQPDLADIHANHGDINILQSSGATGALAAFDKALKISPDFTVAKIGRSSALYGLGRFDDAKRELNTCKQDDACAILIVNNLYAINDATIQISLAAASDHSAGSTINVEKRLQVIQQMKTANEGIYNADMSAIRNRAIGGMMQDLHTVANESAPIVQGMKQALTGDFIGGMRNMTTPIQHAADIMNSTATVKDMTSQIQTETWNNLSHQLESLHQTTGPGGVDTAQLGRTLVDKGNWGLLTRFSLQYPAVRTQDEPATRASTGHK